MSGIIGSKLNHRGSGLVGSLGTDGQHMLSSGAGKKNFFETVAAATTDLTPVRQDVLTLALKQAVQENSTKFNLPNSAITKFEADADFDLAGSTDVLRNDSEYISAMATSTAAADVGGTVTDITDANTDWGYSPAGPYAEDWGTGNDLGTANSYNWGWWSNSGLLTGDFRVGFNGLSHEGFTSAIGATDDYYQWGVTTLDETNIINGSPWGNGADSSASAPAVGLSTGGHRKDIRFWELNGSANSYDGLGSAIDADAEWDADDDEISFVRGGSTLYFQINGVTKYTFPAGSFATTANCYMFCGMGRGTGTPGGSYGGLADPWGWTDCFYRSGMSAVKGLTTITQNATGTALGTTNVPTSAVTEVSGVLLNKDTSGSTTFGSSDDVAVYFTADNSNWTEAASYADSGTFSDTTKMIKLGKTTVTSGSDVRWKIVWANQSEGSKVSNVYGIGLNY
jgi:hypothetical protein